MSKTKHLDTALEILRGKPTSRRGRGTTFTLYADQGILQGPRGKTVAHFQGTPEECKAQAEAHVARIPGATLTIY